MKIARTSFLPGFAFFVAIALLLPSSALSSEMRDPRTSEGELQDLGAGEWGVRETLDDVTSGTMGGIDAVSLFPGSSCDTVVLDGQLWLMFRGNESRMVAKYEPVVTDDQWNLSFEAFAPRELTSYTGIGQQPGVYSIKAMLNDTDGDPVCGIELRVSKAGEQGIYCYDPVNSSWTKVTQTILPAIVHRYVDLGSTPERYVLSFSYEGGNTVLASAYHIGGGEGFSKTVVLPDASTPLPAIRFYDDVSIAKLGTTTYGINGGWMLDNFGVRSPETRYPMIEPAYEYVPKGDPVWLSLRDETGAVIDNASVWIDGHIASYNVTSDRYEMSFPRAVNWAVPVAYSVRSDGIEIDGRLDVTTTEAGTSVSVTKWWNGWEWATVFGLDDCSGPSSALNHYRDYDHPTTAYVQMTSGNSSEVLATQSEIGLHYPHDYTTWMKKSWTESVSTATLTQSTFDAAYSYSSRWDDPAYVGAGDTYISMANPGNSATYQMMYAQYAQGLRIEGIGSNLYNGVPGNASMMGCYWVWGSTIDQYVAWDPTSPYDLMDASRQWSTDNAGQTYERVKVLAERGALLRVYAHPGYPIQDSDILHWIDNDKTNYSYENWKATDGEAASYIYGSWTTDVVKDEGQSGPNAMVFDVSRQDPKEAGYWLVPVTLAVDVTGLDIKRIEVIEGGHTYSSVGSGSYGLRDLEGGRIMDVGYDLRDNMLYVSHFWNDTAQLRIVCNETNPVITNLPGSDAEIDTPYYYNATATPASLGSNTWALDNSSAPWVRSVAMDQTHCWLSGTTSIPGTYSLVLSVHDDDSVSSVSWTITVPEILLPSFVTTAPIRALERSDYSYQAICDQPIDDWTMSTDADWLHLTPEGLLFGAPNESHVDHVFDVNLTATNANGSVYQTFVVNVLNMQPQFITVPTYQIKNGELYAYDPATNEDDAGVTWVGLSTDLPIPYTFDQTNGTVSFLATIAGTYSFNITVSDGSGASNQTAYQSWQVTLSPAPLPMIIGQPGIEAVEDVTYHADFSSDQRIDLWALESDADWLTMMPDGTMLGTPTNEDAGGSFEVKVSAMNENGTSSITFTLYVINVAPQFLTGPPLNAEVGVLYHYVPLFDDQPTGTYVSVMSDLPFLLQFDGSTGAVEFTPDGPGQYWIAIMADDGSNTDNATVVQNWTVTIPVPPIIDYAPPETTHDINGTTMAGWFSTEVGVGLTAWDDLSGVSRTYYRLDGGVWTDYVMPIIVEGQNVHVLEYWSVDIAGNNESIRTLTIGIDQGAPSTEIELNGTEGVEGWYVSSVFVALNGTDDLSGVGPISFRVDGGPWEGYSDVVRLTGEGSHALDYFATDVAGNTEVVHSSVVKIDMSAPVGTLSLSGPSSEWGFYNGAVTVNISTEDDLGAPVRTFIQVDDGGWIAYYGNFTMTADGEHSIQHYGVDVAGNIEIAQFHPFTIDTSAPYTTAQVDGVSGNNEWYVSPVAVSFEAHDNVSGIERTQQRLDGGEWTANGEMDVLLEGDHTIDYFSVDHASNTELEHKLMFRIDTTAPSIMLGVENGTVFTSSKVSIPWTTTDEVSGIEQTTMSIDGGPFLSNDDAVEELNDLSVGEHIVVIRTMDMAGNEASTSVSFTVDTSPFSASNPDSQTTLIIIIIVMGLVSAIGVFFALRRRD